MLLVHRTRVLPCVTLNTYLVDSAQPKIRNYFCYLKFKACHVAHPGMPISLYWKVMRGIISFIQSSNEFSIGRMNIHKSRQSVQRQVLIYNFASPNPFRNALWDDQWSPKLCCDVTCLQSIIVNVWMLNVSPPFRMFRMLRLGTWATGRSRQALGAVWAQCESLAPLPLEVL